MKTLIPDDGPFDRFVRIGQDLKHDLSDRAAAGVARARRMTRPRPDEPS